MIVLEETNSQLANINEMFIASLPSLPTDVENSIYYARIKQLLHPEIYNFCKEQLELKEDLNFLRMSVGEVMTEQEIRDYLDSLKDKYKDNDKVGIEYHIEVTRIDYGVPVFCIIRRGNGIFMKKFVFRFRKANQEIGLADLTNAQVLNLAANKNDAAERKAKADKFIGGPIK